LNRVERKILTRNISKHYIPIVIKIHLIRIIFCNPNYIIFSFEKAVQMESFDSLLNWVDSLVKMDLKDKNTAFTEYTDNIWFSN